MCMLHFLNQVFTLRCPNSNFDSGFSYIIMKKYNNTQIVLSELMEALKEVLDSRVPQIETIIVPPSSNDILTVEQAAWILQVNVSTIRDYIKKRVLPTYRPGKKVYFLKQDIVDWVKAKRRKSQDEIDQEAHQSLESLTSLYRDL